ncbi:hypothetical protein D3C80_1953330 [compost metagenome]
MQAPWLLINRTIQYRYGQVKFCTIRRIRKCEPDNRSATGNSSYSSGLHQILFRRVPTDKNGYR